MGYIKVVFHHNLGKSFYSLYFIISSMVGHITQLSLKKTNGWNKIQSSRLNVEIEPREACGTE